MHCGQAADPGFSREQSYCTAIAGAYRPWSGTIAVKLVQRRLVFCKGFVKLVKFWFVLVLSGCRHLAASSFYNVILPVVLPFWTPKKEAKKVPATSDSARLAAHNERRHPAKRARSCASKPHWGFDCCATAQQPGLGGPPPRNPKEEVEEAKS